MDFKRMELPPTFTTSQPRWSGYLKKDEVIDLEFVINKNVYKLKDTFL